MLRRGGWGLIFHGSFVHRLGSRWGRARLLDVEFEFLLEGRKISLPEFADHELGWRYQSEVPGVDIEVLSRASCRSGLFLTGLHQVQVVGKGHLVCIAADVARTLHCIHRKPDGLLICRTGDQL